MSKAIFYRLLKSEEKSLKPHWTEGIKSESTLVKEYRPEATSYKKREKSEAPCSLMTFKEVTLDLMTSGEIEVQSPP